jgi:hypothetical protein
MPQIGYGAQKLRDGKVYGIGVINDFDSPLANGASIDIGIAWSAGWYSRPSHSLAMVRGRCLGYLYEVRLMAGGQRPRQSS